MSFFYHILITITFIICNAVATSQPAEFGPRVRQLHQFPNMTWIENMAVRSNGQLLLSILTEPELRGINPLKPKSKPYLVYRFPDASSVSGSTEVKPDVFAVVTSNLSIATGASGNYLIWEVNLNGRVPRARKAAKIPANWTINGLTRLSNTAVLGSDSRAGAVYRIDIAKGTSNIAIQDETMRGLDGLPFGVNGIRIHGRYLYYDNTGKGTLCRIPINLHTGTATGPAEVLTDGLQTPDDFTLSKSKRKTYVPNFIENSLVSVSLDGEIEEVAGGPDGKAFVGPTAARFGRTRFDHNVIYVVSSGANFSLSTGGFSFVEGGKVVAVKVRGWT